MVFLYLSIFFLFFPPIPISLIFIWIFWISDPKLDNDFDNHNLDITAAKPKMFYENLGL